MKLIKKILTVLLAVVMMVSLSKTTFAEDSYTITINNAVKGQTYNAYKIFDATHDGNKVSYTISTDSEWYDVMVAYRQEATGVDEEPNYPTYNPFTFTPSASDPTVMVVGLATKPADEFDTTHEYAVEAATLAAYLNSKLHAEGASFTAAATATSTGSSVTLDVTASGEGYYFVDTSLGSICSLDTVTGTAIEINEKNTVPTLTKEVQEDSNGAWVTTATADINQVVNFRLTVTTGYNDNEIDADYVITDTLPAGMSYVDGSVTVKKGTNGTAWTDGYTAVYSNDVLTITLDEAKIESQTNGDATFVIEYQATVDSDAVINGVGNTNTAKLEYHGFETEAVSATVFTYTLGSDSEAIIKKVDTAGNALEGVEFVLQNADHKYAQITDDKLVAWVETETEATHIVTDENGYIVVKGLDADTYTLTEVKALPGYNLLNDTVTAVIAEDGSVTYKLTGATGNGAATIEIVNNSGVELPSTGGIGTTIFTVTGSMLVLGAAILLIVKMRMRNEQ